MELQPDEIIEALDLLAMRKKRRSVCSYIGCTVEQLAAIKPPRQWGHETLNASRDERIAELIGQGLSDKSIAVQMGLTKGQVAGVRHRAKEKSQ